MTSDDAHSWNADDEQLHGLSAEASDRTEGEARYEDEARHEGGESASDRADDTPARLTSQARIDANRRNAQSSTGPRTEAGKRRSAMNAVKHGVFARAHPITLGELQEDPDSVEALLSEVVCDLEPRDALEARQALSIARHYLQLDRITGWEASLLGGAGKFSTAELERLGNEQQQARDNLLTHVISEVVYYKADEYAEADVVDGVTFAEMVAFLQHYAKADKKLIERRGPWTWKLKPPTIANDRQDFNAIVAHYWPKWGALEVWLRPIRRRTLFDRMEAAGRLAEASARRALDALDRTTNLRARIGGQLVRELALYGKLQTRQLPDDRLVAPVVFVLDDLDPEDVHPEDVHPEDVDPEDVSSPTSSPMESSPMESTD